MRVHLISQLLLRRFSTKNTIVVNNKYPYHRTKMKVVDVAYLEAPEDPFIRLERKFGYAETRAATALSALDSGKLLESEKHIESIKKLMALHYVRSQALIMLFQIREKPAFEKMVNDAKKNHPDKLSEIEKSIPTLRRHWLNSFATKGIPSLIKSNIPKIEMFVKKYDIEIGTAPDGVDFALGDIPTLSISKDEKLGILEGVPIDKSDGFIMPLGPKHVVALISKNPNNNYRSLDLKLMASINSKIISQSANVYYTLR